MRCKRWSQREINCMEVVSRLFDRDRDRVAID